MVVGDATYLIALGSNRPGHHGSPARTLRAAAACLPGRVTALSSIIASDPVGPSIRRYANAALVLVTPLDPPMLLAALKRIEGAFGRRRGRRWGTRALDLDIVLWSGGGYASPGLTIPHPAFRSRDFVLGPASGIAAHWRDPVTGRTIRQLRARLARARPVDPRRVRT